VNFSSVKNRRFLTNGDRLSGRESPGEATESYFSAMTAYSFLPFPVLETGQLILRRAAAGDVNELFAMRSNPGSMKYIPRPLARTAGDVLDLIRLVDENLEKNEAINWAITRKDSDRLIGTIGFYRTQPHNFRAEIGYMTHPDCCGKGIATEAIARVCEYGFETMKLHSIEAVIDPENIASARVLEKNRFIKEAHFRQNEFYDGKFLDSVVYSRLKSD
jgi:[ribosomal protein S5]-alanine N-acetyltransferase